MFTPLQNMEFFIDTFQGIKKDLTNKIITDKVMNQAANNYIVAQTAFAKMLVRNTSDLVKHSLESHNHYWFPKS